MTANELETIKQWFETYASQFADSQGQLQPLLQHKVDHTRRVAADARGLARDLGWPADQANRAEALGWLHDIGRFPQYHKYQTFDDTKSFNHGSRAWAIVKKEAILSGLSELERACILEGVFWHNAKNIPRQMDPDIRAWVQLIRDADKLDIFNVVAREIKADGFKSMAKMFPHVKLKGPISPFVIEDFREGRSSSYEKIQTLNDFLVIQLGWIFDIHYSPTFQRIIQRDILAYLIERIPQSDPALHELVQQAEQYVLSRAKEPA